MSSTPRYNVLNVGISALNLQSAETAIKARLACGKKGYICVSPVHAVSVAQEDPSFRSILNQSFLTTPDGMPIVWLGKLLAGSHVERVYGPDLLQQICQATEGTEYSHFFYGGTNTRNAQLIQNLQKQFPKLNIKGHFAPPFRPLEANELEQFQSTITELRPSIIWVGLGAPKQEQFMAQHLGKLDTTLMIGIGAAFDFISGHKEQAPKWMQRSGLEWLFRLYQEPRRLAFRYFYYNPLFIIKVLIQLTQSALK